MSKIQSKILIHKEVGETPLEAVNRFKITNPDYKDLPMTYAGRLDPMAEGLLLILIGEECKQKEKYLELSKEYEVEVLFGFETDTSDILGKITDTENKPIIFKKNFTEKKIIGALESAKNLPQKYPAYSSKTFEGKPLWQWAREGEEKELESDAKITEAKFLMQRQISGNELLKNIEERILKINGDFRQQEILNLWQEKINSNKNYQIISLKIASTGGAYMRVFARDFGKIIGIPALAFSIKRTKIGVLTL